MTPNTYKEMNENIKDILRTGNQASQYAAQRMEELEQQNELKESEYQSTMDKLHKATKLAREYQQENEYLKSKLEVYNETILELAEKNKSYEEALKKISNISLYASDTGLSRMIEMDKVAHEALSHIK